MKVPIGLIYMVGVVVVYIQKYAHANEKWNIMKYTYSFFFEAAYGNICFVNSAKNVSHRRICICWHIIIKKDFLSH